MELTTKDKNRICWATISPLESFPGKESEQVACSECGDEASVAYVYSREEEDGLILAVHYYCLTCLEDLKIVLQVQDNVLETLGASSLRDTQRKCQRRGIPSLLLRNRLFILSPSFFSEIVDVSEEDNSGDTWITRRYSVKIETPISQL